LTATLEGQYTSSTPETPRYYSTSITIAVYSSLAHWEDVASVLQLIRCVGIRGNGLELSQPSGSH
jgi:hypothetical protein